MGGVLTWRLSTSEQMIAVVGAAVARAMSTIIALLSLWDVFWVLQELLVVTATTPPEPAEVEKVVHKGGERGEHVCGWKMGVDRS